MFFIFIIELYGVSGAENFVWFFILFYISELISNYLCRRSIWKYYLKNFKAESSGADADIQSMNGYRLRYFLKSNGDDDADANFGLSYRLFIFTVYNLQKEY